MSILDKNISYFPSTAETKKGVSVNLLTLLQSSRHEARIILLRSEIDPAKQKKLKDNLPCFTVAGLFSQRSDAGLITPSGLAAVDLDSAEDYDVLLLLHELKKIPSIAYAGLSCRGKRLFAIIPFLDPTQYARHYERLIRSFEDIGLPMGDTCHKTISQPRYVSFNAPETCFFNHTARPYHLLAPEKIYHPIKTNAISSPCHNPATNRHFVFSLAEAQKWVTETTGYSLIDGQKHNYIFWLSYALRKNGLNETAVYNTIYTNILSADQIRSNAISGGIAHANANGNAMSNLSENTIQPSPKQNISLIEPLASKPSIVINSFSEASALFLQTGQFILDNGDSFSDNIDLPDPEFERPELKPATGKLEELEDAFIHLTQQPKKHKVNFSPIISLFDKYKCIDPTDEQLEALELLLKS